MYLLVVEKNRNYTIVNSFNKCHNFKCPLNNFSVSAVLYHMYIYFKYTALFSICDFLLLNHVHIEIKLITYVLMKLCNLFYIIHK